MNDRYLSSSWSIEVPQDRSIEEADECFGFVPADERGALQVSAYTKNGSTIPLEDMLRFARERCPGSAEPESVTCGEFRGFTTENVEDCRVWRAWWLAVGRCIVRRSHPVANTDTCRPQVKRGALGTRSSRDA